MSLVSPICGSAHRCLGSWFLLAEVASNPCHAQTISFCRAVKGVTRTTAEDPESACGDACMCKTAVHMQTFQDSEQLANADPHPAPMDDDKFITTTSPHSVLGAAKPFECRFSLEAKKRAFSLSTPDARWGNVPPSNYLTTTLGYPLALSPMQQLLIIKILNKEAKEGHVDDTIQFFVNQLYAAVSSVHTRKSDARTHTETMVQ
ncbi:hypothetical protein NEUTE1DRAFT_114816 [Neurospora tetrasperma FGSC 2508]|uniref:Uncharacterized protein n=1 Tax=Neurospora tetrasperma (strain FGSC 2508 / ATCC MYA-4615 / P0657) TaxID=510951 RepID=F8MZZ8_NEUT8|nr:uncharacterized protein NEUTE1DRAFT_114816 [Neurospora tetrasperma FGSC 2508]EGO52933.1 hypothetical protein NEUTE1DRAFT_114816 [Neurospora tetrasperma FGSC 2508]